MTQRQKKGFFTMEKKSNAMDKKTVSRVVYGTVIAILCITAIVVGIVSAAGKKVTPDQPTPPEDNTGILPPEIEEPIEEKKELSFMLPVSAGVLGTEFSGDVPVFSTTLGEWRLHLGIDIITDEDVPVFAAEDGVITGIYKDARFGYTVEITHDGEYKTVYSNLKNDAPVSMEIGDVIAKGDRIGTVGDSAMSEIAEEPHLHFEIFVGGVAKDPTEFIEGISKKDA